MEVKNYQKKSPSDQLNPGIVKEAIKSGLHYLKNHQYPNGEFCCYYSPDDAMQEWCVPDSTVFPTALINICLLSVKDQDVTKEILKKSIPFFQYQMMRGGVMNYFTKWNPLFALCPPDIDDTVYVHRFLKSQNIDCPDPAEVILTNRASNGLFYTWFTLRFTKTRNKTYWKIILREFKNPIKSLLFWKKNECSRNDIDGVVNANVLLYLGLNKASEPIINYLLDILHNEKEEDCDNSYPNPLSLYYPFSLNIKNGIQELSSASQIIIDRILKYVKRNGSIGESALDTALAISSLINLDFKGNELHNAVTYLISTQKITGEWPRRIYFYSGRSKTVGWGSEELTTGFCIEALAKYQSSIKN